MSETVTVLGTSELLRAARWGRKHDRNRSVDATFDQQLDPDGIHVVAFRMIHNDSEWRIKVLAKMRDQLEPAEVTLDVPLDLRFGTLKKEGETWVLDG